MGLFAVSYNLRSTGRRPATTEPGGHPMNADDLASSPDRWRRRLAGPVGRGGPADDLDIHPRHAFRPADVIRFLQSLTLRFGGDVWWLSYVLFRDALLVITLGLGMFFFMPNLYFVEGLPITAPLSVLVLFWALCVKIVRDPDEDPQAFRLFSILLVVASVLYIVPQIYGLEAADQAYLGDLPSALISSENLAVARPLFWLSLGLFALTAGRHVRPGRHPDPRSEGGGHPRRGRLTSHRIIPIEEVHQRARGYHRPSEHRRMGSMRAEHGAASYDQLYRDFRWEVPERYNIAVDAIDRHAAARPDAPALDRRGRDRAVSRLILRATSGERRTGWRTSWPGTGWSPATGSRSCCRRRRRRAIAHLAAYRAGLIAVPLFVLFGPEAHRVPAAPIRAPSALITDAANWPKVAEIRDRLPDLRTIVVVDGDGVDGTLDYDAAVAARLGRLPRPSTRWRTTRRSSSTRRARPARRRARCTPIASCSATCPGVLLPHDVPAAAGRPVLDAGRLGLDRRPVRRPLPGLALGPAGPRPSRPEVRPGARARPDGAARASATSSCRRPRSS